jgi:Yip1-like protein
MNTSEITTDGSVLVHALAAPDHGFGRVTERRRAGLALALATAASLLTAAVVLPRTDFGAAALAQGGKPGGEVKTEGELAEAAVTARKLGQIAGWAGAALLPSALAVAAAGALFAGFRLAATRPDFKPTLAVTAHAMLPVWLGKLLAIPPAVAHAPVAPEDVPRLVPSSLAALLPAGAPPPLAAALSALDLFTLWAVALVVVGMARASGASRARALGVTLILFGAYVALLKVVPAALAGGAGSGPRGGP